MVQINSSGVRERQADIALPLAVVLHASSHRHDLCGVDEQRGIVGFATVAAPELTTATLSDDKRKRLLAYPIPVLRLARLAVDEGSQGRGIARELLRAVFLLAHRMAADVGCLGVVVDAKPEAVGFYQEFGFLPLEVTVGELGDRPQPLPMFLEIGAIAKPSSA